MCVVGKGNPERDPTEVKVTRVERFPFFFFMFLFSVFLLF